MTDDAGDVAAEPRLLYRDMKADFDNKPEIGPYNWALGVRSGEKLRDIAVHQGMVEATTGRREGGMSVTPDTPFDLPDRHRPPELGGQGSYPVWKIEETRLGPDLRYRQTTPTHGVIEPAHRMHLEEYVAALQATQDYWTRVPASGKVETS